MRKLLSGVVAAFAILSVALLFWFGREPRHSKPKLLVVGIDGLDSRIFSRLVAKGELPTLELLYENSARATIRNSDLGLPPVSPAIWTTYATGVLPEAHRIRGFVFKTDKGWELYRSLDRTSPAFWEIVSQVGTGVGVVNWWFSYPPEKVDGFVVSDRYFEAEVAGLAQITYGRPTGNDAPATHPSNLVSRMTISRQRGLPKVLVAKDAAELDGTMLELAYQACAAVPVETLLIYLNGLDRVSHMSWDAADPEGMGGKEVRQHMRNLDGFLSQLVQWAGPSAHIVILSDHGFEGNPKGDPPGIHESREAADAAVFWLSGPDIEPGKDLGSVSPLDVLPTLLALARVPLPEGISGVILKDAFRKGAIDFSKVQRRRQYVRLPVVDGDTRPKGAAVDAVDEATKERLRALGYIE